MAVLDDEVQVDVVGGAESAAGQRPGDGDAPDERGHCDQRAHEPDGEVDVGDRLRIVFQGPSANRHRAIERRPLDNEVFRDCKLGVGCDGPTHVPLGDGAAKAEPGEPRRRDCVAAASEQRDSAADPIGDRGRRRSEVADSHLGGYGQGLPAIIDPGRRIHKRRK